jgi:hypothetical protein
MIIDDYGKIILLKYVNNPINHNTDSKISYFVY